MKRPTILMVLDGFGINPKTEANAIALANKPNLDKIFSKYPHVQGHASGLAVGLPEGQMGNSEVGHTNIGAGRVVYQELTKITKEINDGEFFENKALLSAIENCKKYNSDLHLYGLVSDGGVHSHNTHLYALLKLAKDNGLENVYVHAFLDGRDTPPRSGKEYLLQLEQKMSELSIGKIATIMGRFYAMDRDNRWDRVEKAYTAMVNGIGETAATAAEAIQTTYDKDVNDEFVLPTIILKDGKPTATIKTNDSIIFFNFRPDRAREITRTFCDEDFKGFERTRVVVKYVCFTDYDITINNKEVAFEPVSLAVTLGEYISTLGLKQLRIAETEKYAHVTFFFNGGIETPYEGEDRILVPSPKEVATYDLKPEMSAVEVTDRLVESILSQKYDLIVINYANPDMVGHTGIIPAAIKAIETVDTCVGRVYDALLKVDGQMFLCADHGNSDQLVDYVTGDPLTSHTTNPVPFVLINAKEGISLKDNGKLADIAPTLLTLMDLKVPKEMTGTSLLIN